MDFLKIIFDFVKSVLSDDEPAGEESEETAGPD